MPYATMAEREAQGAERLADLIDAWHIRPDHFMALSLAKHLRDNGVRNPGDPLAPQRIKAAALKAAAQRMRVECTHDVKAFCLSRADDLDRWADEYLAAIPLAEGGAPDA
jgi:hypothetical protein